MKNQQTFADLLTELEACPEAAAWADGRSLRVAWRTCERADWLLWLVSRMIGKKGWPTHKELVLAACDCAETALCYVPKGEKRPRIAIETARKWAEGTATIEEVRSAAAASNAAVNAYAVNAYAAAAYAAAYAAASAAAYAAAASYAAYAAAYAAEGKAHKTMCKLIRKRLTVLVENYR